MHVWKVQMKKLNDPWKWEEVGEYRTINHRKVHYYNVRSAACLLEYRVEKCAHMYTVEHVSHLHTFETDQLIVYSCF